MVVLGGKGIMIGSVYMAPSDDHLPVFIPLLVYNTFP